MRRRGLFKAIGGTAISWPSVVEAQRASLPIVGFLASGTPEGFAPRYNAMKQGLAKAGFVEGRDVAFEPRWAHGNASLLPQLAAELVTAKAAVIVTAGTEKVVRSAMAATKTVPIVATMAGDPVKRGIVSSISRPGGNITVVSLFTSSSNALISKRVELLHDVARDAKALGWLVDADILDMEDEQHDIEAAANAFGLEVKVARGSRVDDTFKAARQAGAGLLLETGPLFYANRARLVALAAEAGLPALYEWRDFVDEGGLMSYGTNLASIFQQCGAYAARILRGAQVGELPVVQEPKIELIFNMKTARALGLVVPPTLLARADEVIE
jgi:putative ABC transport system substrate-binding protein